MEVLIPMPRGAPSIAAMLAILAILAIPAIPAAASAADPPSTPGDPPTAPAAASTAEPASPAPTPPAATSKPLATVSSPAAASKPRPPAALEGTFLETARLPWYSPATLAYQEGMPIPPGYRLQVRRPRALITAGAALFGASYLTAALTAGTVVAGYDKHRSEVAPLFIPFAGPFITLGTSRDVQLNDVDRRTNGVLLLVDGAAQITGAVLFLVGMATREPYLARTKESYHPPAEEARAAPELFVGGRSAALRWRF